MKKRHEQFERGAVAVEFAIVLTAFVMLLTMIIGFGHWIYTHEMLVDATRLGARMAVVCDIDDTTVKSTIQARVPQLGLTNTQISVSYFPAACTKATCQGVQVGISGATYTSLIPFLPGTFNIPPFTTALPRESLESVNAAGEVNPVCS